MIKKLNTVSKEVILGILICGVTFQAAFIWWWDSKLQYSAGLWIGILLSVLMVIHINRSIEHALDMSEKNAVGHMQLMSLLRAMVVGVIFFLCYLFRAGDSIALLMGLFSLKLGAYLQPLMHRFIGKLLLREKQGARI